MKGSKIFAAVLTYILPLVAIVLYYSGLHKAFLWCSLILLAFTIGEVIIKLVMGGNWIIKIKPILDIVVAFVLGGLITWWKPLDSLCLGVCVFQVICVYEAFFRKLFDEMQRKPEESSSEEECGSEDETESDEETSRLSAREEAKAEAIFRMKQIGLVDTILNDFAENGNVQVYEPPYGCGYDLESDVLKSVRKFESNHDTLVWGVVRSFRNYGYGDVTIDAFLYVSKNKEYWDEERENLFNMTPTVYTVEKEHPERIDIGCMGIYMSEGGTPLRSE